jgi:hypothetical protein
METGLWIASLAKTQSEVSPALAGHEMSETQRQRRKAKTSACQCTPTGRETGETAHRQAGREATCLLVACVHGLRCPKSHAGASSAPYCAIPSKHWMQAAGCPAQGVVLTVNSAEDASGRAKAALFHDGSWGSRFAAAARCRLCWQSSAARPPNGSNRL